MVDDGGVRSAWCCSLSMMLYSFGCVRGRRGGFGDRRLRCWSLG